jgi:flagellar FliL protein
MDMAKDKPKTSADAASETQDTAPAAKPRGKSRALLLIIVFMLLAAGGGGGGWFYLRTTHANAETNPAPKKTEPPAFVNLETFTVNLADREHYLQIGLAYEVEGNETTEAMKVHMPILRSKILLLLSSKNSEELATPDGKTRLATDLVDQARETLPLAAPDKGIAAVHFSAFVIQ